MKAPYEQLVSLLQFRTGTLVPPESLLYHYEGLAYGNHELSVLSDNDWWAEEWNT